MATMILKSYAGLDPQDQSPTLMFGLHNKETGALEGCMAFGDSPEGRALIDDIGMLEMGLALGFYKIGDPNQIAHDFVAQPDTEVLGEHEIEAQRNEVQ